MTSLESICAIPMANPWRFFMSKPRKGLLIAFPTEMHFLEFDSQPAPFVFLATQLVLMAT